MDGDKFISIQKQNKKTQAVNDDNNFFLQADGVAMNISEPEPVRHLNDYDSNILKEGAYREVNDEVFKLEYRISQIETELAAINKQIQTSMEINADENVKNLQIRKVQKENELKELINTYNELSLSTKISGNFTSKIKDGFSVIKNIIIEYGELFLSKVPGKLSSIIEVKNSLTKLENINKSVDELMAVQYPYGEAHDKYEQLSKYIARANSIQSQISKFIQK